MGFDTELISEFKRRLATVKELNEIMEFFLDKLGDSQTFLAMGYGKKPPPKLEAAVNIIISRAVPGDMHLVTWCLREIPAFNLIHGTATIDGVMSVLVYGCDIDMGVMAIPRNPATGEMLYARVTVMSEAMLKNPN